MKKIIFIAFCLLLTSCYETYNVVTDDNFVKSKNNMIDIAGDYGYRVNLIDSRDTMIYGVSNSQMWRYYWTFENYDFVSGSDTFQVNVEYRNQCITEARTIPYVDNIHVGCNGRSEICDTIRHTIENTPKTNIRAITDGSLAGIIIGGAMLPFLSIILYAAIYNVR